MRATGTGGKGLFPIYHVAAVNLGGGGAESYLFYRGTRLRLTTPGDPDFALIDNAGEPTLFLSISRHAINENHGITMTFPASCQRKIGLGDFFGDQPKRKYISVVCPPSQTTIV